MIEEEIKKEYSKRASYLESINLFLDEQMRQAEKRRNSYFSCKNYKERQEEYRNDFKKMLGYPLLEYDDIREENIDFEREKIGESEGIVYYRYTLYLYKRIPLYGILLVPDSIKDKKGKFCMCLHGKEGTPELITGMNLKSANYNNMALRIAKKDCVVFCPQLLLWDMNLYGTTYDRSRIDATFKQLGGSVTAFEVLLLRRCFDFFEKLSFVDKDKMFVSGLSYGGMYALYFSACDERVKGTISSCYFNDRYKYNWPDWCYKNSANEFFDAELSSLIIPRKLFISLGKNDPTFKIEDAKKEIEKIKEYYKNTGFIEQLRIEVFCGEHEFCKSDDGIEFIFDNN